jgi:hypothetical protein
MKFVIRGDHINFIVLKKNVSKAKYNTHSIIALTEIPEDWKSILNA